MADEPQGTPDAPQDPGQTPDINPQPGQEGGTGDGLPATETPPANPDPADTPPNEPESDKGDQPEQTIPDSPEGYQFKAPEGVELDEALTGMVAKVAHRFGAPQEFVSELFSEYLAHQGQMLEAHAAELGKGVEALKTGWGDKATEEMDTAGYGAFAVGGDEFVEFLRSSGAARYPQVIKFLNKVGHMAREGRKLARGSGKAGKNAADILFPNSAGQK